MSAELAVLDTDPDDAPVGVITPTQVGSTTALERVGLGFRLRFPSSKVELGISRIRESSSEVSGELRVRNVAGAFERSVMPISTLNLKSVVARKTMAAALKERLSVVPWGDLLDTFCEQVLEAYRQRAVVRFVGDELPDEDDAAEVLPAPFRSPAVLFGPAGTGKTTLAAGLAVAIETGVEVVPGWRPPTTAPVLYLDWEDTFKAFRDQVRAVSRGAGVPVPRIGHVRMVGALADQLEEVAPLVSERGIGLCVVDSGEPACGAGGDYEGINARVHRLFDAARQLGCEVLILDHPSGADIEREAPSVKPIGGTAKLARARSMFELRAEKDPAADRIEMAMIDTKRNRRSKVPTSGLAVNFAQFDDTGTAHKIWFERCELTAPELVKKQSQREQVRRLLLDSGALLPKQIAVQLGIPESSVRTYVARDDRIIKLQDGRLVVKANV